MTRRFPTPDVVFRMLSVDDAVQPTNPKILSADIPDNTGADSTGNAISFSLEHTGSVIYYLEVSDGSITDPTAVVWTLHDPANDLIIHYDAPPAAGRESVTLSVKDIARGDIVSVEYQLDIIMLEGIWDLRKWGSTVWGD